MQRDKSLYSELHNIESSASDDELKKYLTLKPITRTDFKRICKARGWKTFDFQAVESPDMSQSYEKFFFLEVKE